VCREWRRNSDIKPLPILPIVILFFVQQLIVRLGLILVVTAVFAAVLVFGMNMNSDKVLAITIAYAPYEHSCGCNSGRVCWQY
jgi:hypothetical protein